MSSETIYISGRYNKYVRNLSQSPWIDKNDIRIKDSVQEMLEDGMKKFLSFDNCTFASSGREDVDVRMLGRGRPFAFKIFNPRDLVRYNEHMLNEIKKYINSNYLGKVEVRDLQLVSKTDVNKYLKEGQESKKKEYRALCCCSRKLTLADIERINKIVDLEIEQLTPIRVLQRRTWTTRSRKIHRLRIDDVKLGDFDSVKPNNIERMFTVTLLTDAGTYIKEFVHGDFGRTKPSLATLLGGCDTDLMELDVTEVYLDWPPPKDVSSINGISLPINREDKMESSDEALAELYHRGYQCMQDALLTPRSDKRQELFLESRKALEKSLLIVESLSLFSDNETLEDIATVNLKYLLIPAYLAKIELSGEIQSRRLEAFTKAESYTRQFLRRISLYGFDEKRFEQTLRAIDNNEPPSANQSALQSLEDQMRARDERIKSLNESLELERRLEDLEKRLKSNEKLDDEVIRDYHVKLIQKWILEALEDYEKIVQPGIFFERSRKAGVENMNQEQPSKPRPVDGLDGKNFTIVKDQLQKHAFGLGYPSMPTVSVDEFIRKKIKDGDLTFQEHKEIYSNSLQRYAEQPDLRRDQEEQSDEEHELKADKDDTEELARKRAWDEFKDENPRGSGNRYNMG